MNPVVMALEQGRERIAIAGAGGRDEAEIWILADFPHPWPRAMPPLAVCHITNRVGRNQSFAAWPECNKIVAFAQRS